MSMQQVLNNQERNQAFLKFLLFFLITIVLVIAAVYFNVRLPVVANTELQKQMTVYNQQDMSQEVFVKNMDEAVVYLDSLDKDPKNQEQIVMQLGAKIENLNKLQQKGNSPYARMNAMITYRLTEMKNQKMQLNKLTGKAETLADIEKKLNDCQVQLIQKDAQLDALRKGGGF